MLNKHLDGSVLTLVLGEDNFFQEYFFKLEKFLQNLGSIFLSSEIYKKGGEMRDALIKH